MKQTYPGRWIWSALQKDLDALSNESTFLLGYAERRHAWIESKSLGSDACRMVTTVCCCCCVSSLTSLDVNAVGMVIIAVVARRVIVLRLLASCWCGKANDWAGDGCCIKNNSSSDSGRIRGEGLVVVVVVVMVATHHHHPPRPTHGLLFCVGGMENLNFLKKIPSVGTGTIENLNKSGGKTRDDGQTVRSTARQMLVSTDKHAVNNKKSKWNGDC